MSESPWDKIVDPPPIPEPCTAVMLRLLPENEFIRLLRAHLVPRPDNKARFQTLWIILAFNDDLAERTFDFLEAGLEAADHYLQTVAEVPRVRKFRDFCDGAWNRLAKIRDCDTKPGICQPPIDTTGGKFMQAINEHRHACSATATEVDQALWASLANARDRANRRAAAGEPPRTKGWWATPTFTAQLLNAVQDHRRLTESPRPADHQLWALLIS